MFLTIVSFLYNSFYYVFSIFSFIISMLHSVLPLGIDVGLLGVAAFYATKLRKPNPKNVLNIFGPDPTSKEGKLSPEKVLRCIAHRGANLDAPENTLEAFKYCVEHECRFVELDVRACSDGRLVLLHDKGLERVAGIPISDVGVTEWDTIKGVDVAANHPNRDRFQEVRPCLLDDALDYLMTNEIRIIIDVKGTDKMVIEGVLKAFEARPLLHQFAAVTSFNPFVLYQIRRKNPQIVGAISYRPYVMSCLDYDADSGPLNPRYTGNLPVQSAMKAADWLYAKLWRMSARWCSVSAVLLHKDMVSCHEVWYWRSLGVRCVGWSVNRPLEKLYWRGVLRAPYLAGTLLGEPPAALKNGKYADDSVTNIAPDAEQKLLSESSRTLNTGRN